MDARDSFLVGLLRNGVRARLPSSWQPEESSGAGKSLGLIEVELGPIRWVTLRRLQVESADIDIADFAIPDMRLAKFPDVERLNVHFGSARRWSGDDLGLGILDALNADPGLAADLPAFSRVARDTFDRLDDGQSLVVRAHPGFRFWTLSLPVQTRMPFVLGILGGRRLRVPAMRELEAFQQVARVLLNARLSSYFEDGSPAIPQTRAG